MRTGTTRTMVRVAVIVALAFATVMAPVALARSVHRHHHQQHHHRPHRRQQRHHRRVVPKSVAASPPAATGSGGPCPGADLTPSVNNLALVDGATLCLINLQRAQAGLVTLSDDGRLDRAAAGHSQDMVDQGYFSHFSPSGSTPLQRLLAVGYINPLLGYALGENIAWGTLNLSTPTAIVTAWMGSPEHRANILDPDYRQSGIGVVAAVPGSLAQGQAGATYTQDFGRVS